MPHQLSMLLMDFPLIFLHTDFDRSSETTRALGAILNSLRNGVIDQTLSLDS